MSRPYQQNELFPVPSGSTLDAKKFTCVERSAVVDTTGTYRYQLVRILATGHGSISFILLNPSKADHQVDDPTLLRCLGFAHTWGFRQIILANLFAYRSSDPCDLRKATDPIGPENDRYLMETAQQSDVIIVGWGMHGGLYSRDRTVCQLLHPYKLWCLGITSKTRQPRHPLYLKRASLRIPFPP